MFTIIEQFDFFFKVNIQKKLYKDMINKITSKTAITINSLSTYYMTKNSTISGENFQNVH